MPFTASLAGEVADFDPTDFILPKKARRMGRVSQFAVASALMAARDAALDWDRENREQIAVCFGTSVGGLKEAFEAHDSMLAKQYKHTNPFTMTTTFPNAVSAEVSIALGTHGECETYSIGCSSTANAVGRAYDLIRSHDVDIAVVGGAEAPLHPTIFSAMDAGRTLAPDQGGTIRNLPRPFDRTRCGIVLGEGAGALLLEELEFARARGAKIWGEVVGVGSSTVADKIGKPNLEKAVGQAVKMALADAKLDAKDIGHIHAHGLSTKAADASEAQALAEIFPSSTPVVAAASTTVMAHHGWGGYQSAEFEIEGTVTHDVTFNGPHATMKITVNDQVWDLTLAPPARTAQAGLKSGIIPVGATILAHGHRHVDPKRFDTDGIFAPEVDRSRTETRLRCAPVHG